MGGYFMEEVRRTLITRLKYGEEAEDGPNSVYAGGLWVRTSMVPEMQDAAAEALREGFVTPSIHKNVQFLHKVSTGKSAVVHFALWKINGERISEM
jgi:membrane carboxypeptidase/penicillin-binding protein